MLGPWSPDTALHESRKVEGRSEIRRGLSIKSAILSKRVFCGSSKNLFPLLVARNTRRVILATAVVYSFGNRGVYD